MILLDAMVYLVGEEDAHDAEDHHVQQHGARRGDDAAHRGAQVQPGQPVLPQAVGVQLSTGDFLARTLRRTLQELPIPSLFANSESQFQRGYPLENVDKGTSV